MTELEQLRRLISDFVRAHQAMVTDPGKAPNETGEAYLEARTAIATRYEATIVALRAVVS